MFLTQYLLKKRKEVPPIYFSLVGFCLLCRACSAFRSFRTFLALDLL